MQVKDSNYPQLALRLSRKPYSDFPSFYTGNNQQLVQRLQQLSRGVSQQWVYLWGAPQSGRSHLCQAVAQQAEDSGLEVFYLAGTEACSASPLLLENLSCFQLVVIDDIQALLKDRAWEEALFHLYNNLKEQGAVLVVSGDAPPRQLQALLPDLVSRLMAMEIYQVVALDDADKEELIRLMARQRGFLLSDEVIAFVLNRSDRSLAALQAVVERLDHQSLQEKRMITIPFVKKVMGW
jgi:DnaA family protein